MLRIPFPLGEIISVTAVERAHVGGSHPKSTDWKGTRHFWHHRPSGECRHALDVERIDTPIPRPLRPERMSRLAFFTAWTIAEVHAKLLDIPITLWLRSFPLFTLPRGRVVSVRAGQEALSIFTDFFPNGSAVFSCGLRATSSVTRCTDRHPSGELSASSATSQPLTRLEQP